MRAAELRTMTVEELRNKEEELKREILTLRFQKA
ncbi:MAG TPA: 50S ribosomal protein L29, partial [Thermosulfidibacter takaii]|nr:50S ribosomal protein L29 [Thermosulfidibacter takaii]